MTVWNSAPFLAEAIESVLAQQVDVAWELIIVDDGSTDESLSIALSYAARDPVRISVLRHPGGRNRGISASRNLALRQARAPVVAFLDSDDVWLPHRLSLQLPLLDAHHTAAMVYSNAERWYDPTRVFDLATAERAWWGENYLPPLLPPSHAPGLLDRGELLRIFLQGDAYVPCICSVLVRTEVARAVGGFENPFRGLYDDQVFHAKVSLAHPVYVSNDCVARYRQHPASCCAISGADEWKRAEEQAHFQRWLAAYQQRLIITPSELIAAD